MFEMEFKYFYISLILLNSGYPVRLRLCTAVVRLPPQSTHHWVITTSRVSGSKIAMKSLRVIFSIVVGLYTVFAIDGWAYSGEHGPDHWPGICTTGSKQSPINIVAEDTVRIDLGTLKFRRYDFKFPGKITNNGHTVKIQLDGMPLHLTGGNLSSTYVLEQMHFHWPAEHTVNNNRDALEMHFVHYDIRYNNASMASQHKNGIVVISTLFELSNEDNMQMTPVLKATKLVSKLMRNNTAVMETEIIPYSFLPKDQSSYYYYDGSLTTPGCQESVIWLIFTQKLMISERQVNIFKNIETTSGTLDFNFRPLQTLGKRKVYHHLSGYSNAISNVPSLPYVLISLTLLRLLHFN